MRDRFLMTLGTTATAATAASVVALLSLTPLSAAGQARTAAPKPPPAGSGTPAQTPPAGAKTSPAKAWTPRRLPDGQPDISGIWLAQGIGTEPKVGGPFDAASSASLIAGRLQEAVATGGTLTGVGRCSNVYWDPKPDLTIPKGIVDPPDGQVPLTPFGEQKRAQSRAFQAQKDRPTPDQFEHWITAGDETCMPGTPYPMFNVLPYSANQFFQGPGYVLMVQEFSHISRYIPVDGRPHLPSNIRQWMGDSRGHWEGNTLVVDVTNYNGKSRFDGNPGAGSCRATPPMSWSASRSWKAA